jgi:hypothetical protein
MNYAESKRNYFPAAQGVKKWFRTIGGKTYMFTLVTAGWWGVPPTGTLHVWYQISNHDWYIKSTYHVSV